jgi:hypothetical protein
MVAQGQLARHARHRTACEACGLDLPAKASSRMRLHAHCRGRLKKRRQRERAPMDQVAAQGGDSARSEIDLDAHRQVIVDALTDALATEHHLMAEQGDHAESQRQDAYARALTIETWADSVGLEVR